MEHFWHHHYPPESPRKIKKLYANDKGERQLWDPVAHLGTARVEKSKAAAEKNKKLQAELLVGYHFLILAFLPAALFFLTLLSVGIFYDSAPAWVLLVCALAVVKSLVCIMFFRNGWMKWLGLFFLAAALTGTLVGLYYYYMYLAMYNHYRAARSFTNVAPSQSALLFEDAGMLRFTSDTYIDRQRSVGYLSARRREIFCVAPILDLRMSSTEEVSFFAAGVNCCQWRGSFSCDDADEAGARSALLHVEPEQILSSATAWMAQEDIDSEAFAPAINLTQASFGLRVAKDVRLLRWAKDPLAMREQLRWRAMKAYSVACALFLAALVVGALCGAIGRKRIRKKLSENFKSARYHKHLPDEPA